MRYLLPSLTIKMFYGCQVPVSLVNAHEWSAFHLYKEQNDSATNIRLDGFYYPTRDTGDNCLVLYADGSFLGIRFADYVRHTKIDSAYINRAFEKMNKAKASSFTTSSWGIFRVRHDSIFFQRFPYKEPGVFGKGALYKYVVENLGGTIKNDSTLFLINYDCSYCYENNYPSTKVSFNPPSAFKFYFTNGNKPDSSGAWFNKKRWYKNATAAKQ